MITANLAVMLGWLFLFLHNERRVQANNAYLLIIMPQFYLSFVV